MPRVLQITVSDEESAVLDAVATDRRLTRSDVAREAVSEFVRRFFSQDPGLAIDRGVDE